jgi:hypothetical protein
MVKKRWLRSQFKDYDERLLKSMAWGTFIQQRFYFLQPQGKAGAEALQCITRHVRLESPALSGQTHAVKALCQGYRVIPRLRVQLKESFNQV